MLQAHRPEIEQFVDCLFRYADAGTYVSLRAFDQVDRGRPALFVQGVSVGDSLNGVIDAAQTLAERAANTESPTVFAPPVATFGNPQRARSIDVANGVALSVEVDAGDTKAAQRRLESILGQVTVAAASGGEWIDADTGEVHPKLHLHWRLSEPTRTPDEHGRLQQARWLAAVLVDADRTAAPPAHPLRWPGSWNLKATPKMAMVVEANQQAEIHLDEALAALEEAVEAAGLEKNDGPRVSGEPQSNADLITSALGAMSNNDVHWDDWVRIGMAAWRATGASDDGLEAWKTWSMKSGKYVAGACENRWTHFGGSAPSRIGAGTIFWLAAKEGWVRPYRMFEEREPPVDEAPPPDGEDAYGAEGMPDPPPNQDRGQSRHNAAKGIVWGRPIDFFTDKDRPVPELLPEHLPAVIYDFAMDIAGRMGVDPWSVALAALASCSSVMTDDWRVQPKRFDYEWTEQPRLWMAIVGDPSIKKSPQLSACTKGLEKLDIDARKRHQEAMRQYKRKLKDSKKNKDKDEDAVEPQMPKLDRFLVEGTTVEALSEVLRDDDEATQNAPMHKVLCRHDEMSEFFGNLDRYKSGGKGSGDRGAYLRLFNGSRYTVDRIMRGSFAIPNWSACFIGGIQPGPIQKIAQDSADDGLLQRLDYAVPSLQAAGQDRAPDHAVVSRYDQLFPALVSLGPPLEMDREHYQVVKIHVDGHRDREDVDLVVAGMIAMNAASPRLQSALGKWGGKFARLSLILHLIEIADARARQKPVPHTLIVRPETTAMVARLMCEVMLPHLLRANALMFRTELAGHVEKIASWLVSNKLKSVSLRDVMRNYRPLGDAAHRRELNQVMDTLVVTNWLDPVVPENPMKPVTNWLVNPSVHEQFAHQAEWDRARREQLRMQIEAAKTLKAGRREQTEETSE